MLKHLSWSKTLNSLAVVESLITPTTFKRAYLVTTRCTDLQMLGILIIKKSCHRSTPSFTLEFKKSHCYKHQEQFQHKKRKLKLLLKRLCLTSQVKMYQRHQNLSLVTRLDVLQSLKPWTNSSERQLLWTWITWSRDSDLTYNHLKTGF